MMFICYLNTYIGFPILGIKEIYNAQSWTNTVLLLFDSLAFSFLFSLFHLLISGVSCLFLRENTTCRGWSSVIRQFTKADYLLLPKTFFYCCIPLYFTTRISIDNNPFSRFFFYHSFILIS